MLCDARPDPPYNSFRSLFHLDDIGNIIEISDNKLYASVIGAFDDWLNLNAGSLLVGTEKLLKITSFHIAKSSLKVFFSSDWGLDYRSSELAIR